MKKNILLTGRPGVGKTTMILKLASDINIKSGFYTREIRKDKERIGFEIVTFDGERKILSSVKITSPYRVGKYYVDLSAMKIGCESIKKGFAAGNLIIIDEIGKMELLSKDFRDIVTQALNSDCNLLATITMKPHPFADEIKKRKDVELFTLTKDNFNETFEKIKSYFKL